MRTSQVYNNIFSADEINRLIDYYNGQPYTVEKFRDNNTLKYRNKNNDYNIKGSVPYNLIYPKLLDILGDHKMQYGAYLESHFPYSIHVDNSVSFQNQNHYQHLHFDKNIGILIPLSENQYFKTIFFDYFIDQFDCNTVLPKISNEPLEIGEDLDHVDPVLKEKIKYIPLDQIFNWKIGDIAIWNRNQLHSASNFLPSGKFKTAITLFL